MNKIVVNILIFCVIITGCTTQQNVVRVESQVQEVNNEQRSLKRKVAIARFTNETQYAKGIFYDKNTNNPVEKQAADILATKLASSGKFLLLERDGLDAILEEMKIAGGNAEMQKIGADYLIFGSVTEFGRKNVGDQNVFSRSKTQTVNAGVSLRLVDVSTGLIIYSEEGKGEATTIAKTSMGLGETADYDQTLNDKAISIAISKLVENIINNCMNRPWKSYFLSYDENGIIISGGESQGLRVNDVFDVYEKGKKVKNPQTGMTIELPGNIVGKVRITYLGGETPQSQFSMVSFTEGDINKEDLGNYLIKKTKK
jgi:curli biogenesis system outer membrane secretion channel CsgG